MTTRVLQRACLTLAVLTTAPAVVAGEEFPVPEFPVPAGFRSGYRDVDGVRLHYVTGGRGPLVLLVHGFGQSWYEWHQLMPRLARDHTVLAPDLPGLGQSAPPKSYAGQDVAPLLHHLAKSFSPAAPFDLVAHDIGIWNTYPMAVGHQADVRRLVYMEAPIPDQRLYDFPAFTPQGESAPTPNVFIGTASGRAPAAAVRVHEVAVAPPAPNTPVMRSSPAGRCPR